MTSGIWGETPSSVVTEEHIDPECRDGSAPHTFALTKMTKPNSTNESREQFMEQMMFVSHTMNFWIPLYHYLKMGGSFKDLSTHGWIFDGVPKEYIAPPQEIEVMNDFWSFHEFRQMMITHLYKEYVEEWGSREGD